MSISDATLGSDVWTAIKNLIVSASPTVTLGGTSTTSYTAQVEASYNDKYGVGPLVIVNPIENDEKVNKFGVNRGSKIITVYIDCIYKNTMGIDQLSDQVINAVAQTRIDGIELAGWTTSYQYTDANQVKYQIKTATLTYTRD